MVRGSREKCEVLADYFHKRLSSSPEEGGGNDGDGGTSRFCNPTLRRNVAKDSLAPATQSEVMKAASNLKSGRSRWHTV